METVNYSEMTLEQVQQMIIDFLNKFANWEEDSSPSARLTNDNYIYWDGPCDWAIELSLNVNIGFYEFGDLGVSSQPSDEQNELYENVAKTNFFMEPFNGSLLGVFKK